MNKPKGGQHVGPSVGPIARLIRDNRDLKNEMEELKAEVDWLETPMRARHKRLLAAAEEHLEFGGCLSSASLRAAIADCKRDGPK